MMFTRLRTLILTAVFAVPACRTTNSGTLESSSSDNSPAPKKRAGLFSATLLAIYVSPEGKDKNIHKPVVAIYDANDPKPLKDRKELSAAGCKTIGTTIECYGSGWSLAISPIHGTNISKAAWNFYNSDVSVAKAMTCTWSKTSGPPPGDMATCTEDKVNGSVQVPPTLEGLSKLEIKCNEPVFRGYPECSAVTIRFVGVKRDDEDGRSGHIELKANRYGGPIEISYPRCYPSLGQASANGELKAMYNSGAKSLTIDSSLPSRDPDSEYEVKFVIDSFEWKAVDGKIPATYYATSDGETAEIKLSCSVTKYIDPELD